MKKAAVCALAIAATLAVGLGLLADASCGDRSNDRHARPSAKHIFEPEIDQRQAAELQSEPSDRAPVVPVAVSDGEVSSQASQATASYGFWGATKEEAEQQLADHFTRGFYAQSLRRKLLSWKTASGVSEAVPIAELDPYGDGGLPAQRVDELREIIEEYNEAILEFEGPLQALVGAEVDYAMRTGQVVVLPVDTPYIPPRVPQDWSITEQVDAGDFTYHIALDLRKSAAIADVLAEVERLKEERRYNAQSIFR